MILAVRDRTCGPVDWHAQHTRYQSVRSKFECRCCPWQTLWILLNNIVQSCAQEHLSDSTLLDLQSFKRWFGWGTGIGDDGWPHTSIDAAFECRMQHRESCAVTAVNHSKQVDGSRGRTRKKTSLSSLHLQRPFRGCCLPSTSPHIPAPPATTAQERKITTCRKQSLRFPFYRYRENVTPRLAADPANIWQHTEPTLWRNQLLIEPTIRHD